MTQIEKTVKVSKESFEIADMLGDLVIEGFRAVGKEKKEKADIISTLLPTFINKFPNALEGFDLVDDEAKEDAGAFMMAWLVVGQKVYTNLRKK